MLKVYLLNSFLDAVILHATFHHYNKCIQLYAIISLSYNFNDRNGLFFAMILNYSTLCLYRNVLQKPTISKQHKPDLKQSCLVSFFSDMLTIILIFRLTAFQIIIL